MAAKVKKKTNKAAKKPTKAKSPKPKASAAKKSKAVVKKTAPTKKEKVAKEKAPAKLKHKKEDEPKPIPPVLADEQEEEEEEFDPQAFFEASGGKGVFRAHVMRKERVDFNLPVRYRYLTSPLVFNADLLNLSKGGLALKTPKVVKAKVTVRVEIPLPHTSELFTLQAECIWSEEMPNTSNPEEKAFLTGFRFLAMSLAKQTVINNFIQQRRDEVVLAKIGLDKFKDSAPVVGID